MERVILHIDMNSYFASVEQQANPFLRGRAVGVCAYLSENGCILASSMEAKQHSVKTGMRVREARRLWPETIFLQNDPPKYRSTTERIFNILAEYADQIEPYSIDEAFLDLTGWTDRHPLLTKERSEERSPLEAARLIGLEINHRIKREVGEWLRASIGVAATRFFAKLASDTGPKDSVTVLPPASVPQYLHSLDLEDVWGIAHATRRKLEALGIHTPLQFRNADPIKILSALGKYGYYLWASLNGYETNEAIMTQEEPKSIGHSYCLAEKTKDPRLLAAILMKLCEKTGRRLRATEFDARAISAGYTCEDGSHCGRHHRLPFPLFDSFQIFQEVWRLLRAESISAPVRMLAVSVSSFTPPSNQLALPLELGEMERGVESRSTRRNLTKALDAVNDKWGEYTVIRGAMLSPIWIGPQDRHYNRIRAKSRTEGHAGEHGINGPLVRGFGTDKSAPDRIGYRKSLHAPEISETITATISE